jgi:hypothetical protein
VGALTLKLGAVVGSYGIEDDEADVMSGQKHGDLVLEDVVLGFEVRGDGAVDGIERWAELWLDGLEHRIVGEHLGKTTGGQGCFGGDVEGLTAQAVRGGQLDSETETEESLRLACAALAGELGHDADGDAAA